MAAAANHRKSQKLMDQTFFLSNMAPQVNVFLLNFGLKMIHA